MTTEKRLNIRCYPTLLAVRDSGVSKTMSRTKLRRTDYVTLCSVSTDYDLKHKEADRLFASGFGKKNERQNENEMERLSITKENIWLKARFNYFVPRLVQLSELHQFLDEARLTIVFADGWSDRTSLEKNEAKAFAIPFMKYELLNCKNEFIRLGRRDPNAKWTIQKLSYTNELFGFRKGDDRSLVVKFFSVEVNTTRYEVVPGGTRSFGGHFTIDLESDESKNENEESESENSEKEKNEARGVSFNERKNEEHQEKKKKELSDEEEEESEMAIIEKELEIPKNEKSLSQLNRAEAGMLKDKKGDVQKKDKASKKDNVKNFLNE